MLFSEDTSTCQKNTQALDDGDGNAVTPTLCAGGSFLDISNFKSCLDRALAFSVAY